jgi:futalosine hydrolase
MNTPSNKSLMRIGVVAATRFEIQPFIDFFQRSPKPFPAEIDVVMSGIGVMSTTYKLAGYITQKKPDFILQAGIGGAFDRSVALSSTALIQEEVLGDLGVEESGLWNDIFDMGFADMNADPFANRMLPNPFIHTFRDMGCAILKGVTVNEITTGERRIEQLRLKYDCDGESMEGAALHYVCLQEKVRFLQIRGISNYVGERNKANWQIKKAIENLNEHLIKALQKLSS